MTTLKPGIIYQAVQDRRENTRLTGWLIFDRYGMAGSAYTLDALRNRLEPRPTNANRRPAARHLRRGIHPKFKGESLGRFMEDGQASKGVSIYWFVIIGEDEIDLEGI